MRHAYALPPIAGKFQALELINALTNGRATLLVTQVILGSGLIPPRDVQDRRLTVEANDVMQLARRDFAQRFVRVPQQLGMASAAQKHADQLVSCGRSMGEFHARETRGDNVSPFDEWDDGPEIIERPGQLCAIYT